MIFVSCIFSAMDQLRAFEGEKSRQDSILGHLQQITNKSDELERYPQSVII